MRSIFLNIQKLAAFAGCVALFCTSALAQSTSYSVTFKDTDKNQVHVEAYLQIAEPELAMTEFGPVPEQWGLFVRNLAVVDDNKAPVPTQQLTGRTWQIQADAGSWVNVSYDIDLSHQKLTWPGGIDGVAFKNGNGIYATGRSLFIMSAATQEPITVTMHYPESWSVHTPWAKTAVSNSYLVDDNQELSESIIMVGDAQNFMLDTDELQVEFVLTGESIKDMQPLFEQRAQKLLSYYSGLMGGPPRSSTDKKHDKKMLVIINEHDMTDGEVIGGHISMLLNPQAPPDQQLITWFLYAHEFFHLWNGRSIQVAAPTADWFKEGITNYYTVKGLLQTGIIPPEAAFMVTEQLFYQRYVNDPGLGQLSLSQAAIDDKDGHWGLVYGGGFFIGVALDGDIRQATDNQQSLDDVMRSLYTTYAGKDRFYSSQDIRTIVSRIGGQHHASLFKNYVLGKDIIDVPSIFTQFGFNATVTNGRLMLSENDAATTKQLALRRGFYGQQ